jgi:hypothetical protein
LTGHYGGCDIIRHRGIYEVLIRGLEGVRGGTVCCWLPESLVLPVNGTFDGLREPSGQGRAEALVTARGHLYYP